MENKIIYDTLENCVNKLWNMIDFENAVFPDVDFATWVDENANSPEEAYDTASGWFGIKDLGKEFDCDTISIMIAHYGGGGIGGMELSGYENEKEYLIELIMSLTEKEGCDLKRDEMTVFEIKAK